MPTLWFSYSLPDGIDPLTCDEPRNSPYTISWHVSRFLARKAAEMGYTFRYVNLDDTTPQTFTPDDIVIGHTWFSGGFMHQALDANVRARFILQPYSHHMVSSGDVQTVLDLFNKADHLFLITGEYWWQTMNETPYAVLQDKATRLDMAINPIAHPFKKTRWNRAGERAIACIGNDIPVKGFRHVAGLARMTGTRLGHFGSAREHTFDHVPCLTLHGGHLFTPDVIEAVCQSYDALVVLADSDANPTVLLEAASWGLTVFCNQQGGYLPDQPFKELRLNDPLFNVRQIRAWQSADEYTLGRDSDALRHVIATRYTWDTFTQRLWSKACEWL